MSFLEILDLIPNEAIKVKTLYWLELPILESTKQEIVLLIKQKDWAQLEERLNTPLKFGTAGVRALMGFGFNRLNELTIAKITLGILEYIQNNSSHSKTIVIGYDSRHNSKEFAQLVSQISIYIGMKPILFTIPSPSPLLAYATTFYKACLGIMITASHNPKEYNGYKIYNHFGGQFISSETNEIIDYIDKVKDIPLAKFHQVNIENIDNPTDDLLESFFSSITKNIPPFNIDIPLSVVYSPLFGAGKFFAPKMIEHLGGKLIIVEEQNEYNGNFPSCDAPNPEIHNNFDLAIEYAKKNNASLCVLTDPDADRLGLWENGYFFTGNEIGILLSYFLLTQQNQNKTIISSLVSTQMTGYIAEYFGASYIKTLTGFKYIGNIVQNNPKDFLFGFEESYGFLIGPYIQDKDAIGTLGLIYTMASYLKNQGKTCYHLLEEIYEKVAFSQTKTIELTLSDNQMIKIMDNLLKAQDSLLGHSIIEMFNFESQEYLYRGQKQDSLYFREYEKTKLLIFKLEDFMSIGIRPSGTEPKLKIYIELLISAKENVDTERRNNYLEKYEILLNRIKHLEFF